METRLKTFSAYPDAAVPAEPHASLKGALAALSLSILLAALGTSIANVGLPSLALAFGASFQAVQWIVIAYLLAITTLIVSVGRLGDMIGRRRLLLGGILVFTLASAASGMAPSLGWLIAARAVQGLGAAIMMALAMAFVGETVPKAKTGSAMGLLGSASAIGTALGPSLGGLLIAVLGWQAIFLINVPLGLVALTLAWRYLPENRSAQAQERARFDHARFDHLGTLLLALTLAAYALAMTLGRGDFGALNMVLLMAAALGAGLFLLAQARVASPLIRLAAFRNPVLSGSLAVNALVSTVMMATLVVGPFYLSGTFGLNPALVGLVMAIGPVVSALSGVPAGRLVDRLGASTVVVTGLVAMVAGASGLALLPAMFGLPGYIAAIILLTPGYQLFQAANNTTVMMDVDPAQRGVISGLLNLSRNLGLVTGASFMGAVFALASGASDVAAADPASIAAGMRVTFAVAAILIIAGLGVVIGGRAFKRG